MKTSWKSRRPHAIALALAAAMLAGAIALPTPLRAQESSPTVATDAKMQLQLQALDAKRDGDYAKAKDLLQKIIAIDPKDPSNAEVQRQIDVIDSALASQSAGKPTIFNAGPAAPATTAAVATRPIPADAPADAAKPDAPAPTPTAEATAAMAAEAANQNGKLKAIGDSIDKADAMMASGDFDGARATLDAALAQVPAGIKFADIRNAIKDDSNGSWFLQAQAAYKANNLSEARADLAKYVEVNGGDDSRSIALAKSMDAAQNNPMKQSLKQVASPGFIDKADKVQQLLVRGRAQYLYGDFYGAEETFNQVKTLDPDNVEAKAYRIQIDKLLFSRGHINHDETRYTLLRSVEDDWNLPAYSSPTVSDNSTAKKSDPIMDKLSKIFIPTVNIDVPTPLDQVVQVLHDLSVRYDPDGKGINFHVYPPSDGSIPKVSLPGLNGLSLDQLLRVACSDAHPGYSFGPDNGVISLREGGSLSLSNGEFSQERIPLSESEMKELGLNVPGADAGAPSAKPATDPFAASGASPATPAADASSASTDDTAAQLTKKFMDANIDFPAGSKITMLGSSKISVVNTPANIEKLKQFLRTLDDVKQVEIEARFLDISQGALKTLGTRWNVTNARLSNDFLTTGSAQNSNLRSLSNAFNAGATGAAPTVVTGLTTVTTTQNIGGVDFVPGSVIVPQVIPTLPGALNTGSATSDMFSGVVSWLDGYRIQMVLDALDQEDGNDLMASPKLTVMDGTEANITVAQEFRYPSQFSGVTSTVSPASSGNSGGGGGISISAGTPSGFDTPQEIGVTMKINPSVQPDDSIRLFITPNVTEFEGFIEYGSASIAIQGTISAIVPSGVIQPIFDVRTLVTTVTIYDGATVVMGGLTRDEIKTVNDKVPVLGDIPLIGRLFQSKGESSQKRNLMIFVTANLISPGGAPTSQSFQNLQRGAIFSNPTLLLPGGPFQRTQANTPAPGTASDK